MKTAAVIPCYRVKEQILRVIEAAESQFDFIVCVDDHCPEASGEWIRQNVRNPKVNVIQNEKNLGVGGTVLAGFAYARDLGANILVKLDGDGQMDPRLAPQFIEPIAEGRAEYTKGNRFHSPEALRSMPTVRLIGNAALSFLTKASSGYWHLMDPTNGYIAISANTFAQLPVDKISSRYFFESDMLFRLNFVGARVIQIPMMAFYGDEKSSLSISKSLFEFGYNNLKNFFKRLVYSYFVLDFNLGSLALVFGLLMMAVGVSIGGYYWVYSVVNNHPATSGQVMMAALPTLLGFQSLFFFFTVDIANSSQRFR